MEMKYRQDYSQGGSQVPLVQRKKSVNVCLVIADIFAIVALVLLAASIGTNYWYKLNDRHFGLFKVCNKLGCEDITEFALKSTSDQAMNSLAVFNALRGIAFAGLAFIALSVLLISLALCDISPRGCAIGAGVLLIFSSVFVGALVALFVIIYVIVTAAVNSAGVTTGSLIGYSLILCFVTEGLAFIAGILAYVGACVNRRQDTAGIIIVSN